MIQEIKPKVAGRRRFLGGTAIALAGAAGMTGTVAGDEHCDVLVDGSGGGDATTVQGGVDLASPGDTVCVADGTYTEHVHVDKDLTLTNAPSASPTIAIPSDPPDYDIPESGGNWETAVFVGPETGTSTVDVDVSGLIIDGNSQQPNTGRAAGILLRNVEGSVTDVTVTAMAVGGKQTGGIAVYGDATLAVHDNTVDGYERFGIVANGDGGANPTPTADIKRNEVTGAGGIGEVWAPNGIQIGFGASGNIKNNVVDNNRFSDSAQVASGLIVFESDKVTVANNTVTESDGAITVGSWAWFRQTASGTKISNNVVNGAIVGVHLEARADPFGGAIQSLADPTVRNTKIVNNDITQGETGDPSESVGIQFVTDDTDPGDSVEPVITNTKVIRNEITGFDTPTDTDDGTNTKQRANPINP